MNTLKLCLVILLGDLMIVPIAILNIAGTILQGLSTLLYLGTDSLGQKIIGSKDFHIIDKLKEYFERY